MTAVNGEGLGAVSGTAVTGVDCPEVSDSANLTGTRRMPPNAYGNYCTPANSQAKSS